jgi:hypothetical protein
LIHIHARPTKPTIDLDIRYFKRYPIEVDFLIKIKNKSFWVQLIDYSFNGISFIAQDSLPLQIGDVIDLHIDELNVHQKGKIQWTKQLNTHMRFGILKLGPVTGSFKYYRLSDILIGLQKTLKTGILDVIRGKAHKKIYIKNGNMIFAKSNRDKDRLAHILLQHHKINKQQYSKAIERQKKTGKRFAAVLVDLGYLKPIMLKEAVVLQVKTIIGSLFDLHDALFVFNEVPFPVKDIIALKLSVANLIYTEVKRTADVSLL